MLFIRKGHGVLFTLGTLSPSTTSRTFSLRFMNTLYTGYVLTIHKIIRLLHNLFEVI